MIICYSLHQPLKMSQKKYPLNHGDTDLLSFTFAQESQLEFLNLFKKTFSKVHWNELSVSEAQNLSALIVDTLKFCQAENQMINSLLKEVLVELQSANLSTRFLALRSSLILLQYIFPEFPKQVNISFCSQVFIFILGRSLDCGCAQIYPHFVQRITSRFRITFRLYFGGFEVSQGCFEALLPFD